MGFLASLLGGGVKGVVDTVADAADRFIETPDEKSAAHLKELALELKSDELKQALQKAQMEVNTQEAKHASVFVAGWRPAVGWTCCVAFLYAYVLQPFLIYAALFYDPTIPQPPDLDLNQLIPVLGGMLGIGAMRSYEKAKGVHRDSLKPKEQK